MSRGETAFDDKVLSLIEQAVPRRFKHAAITRATRLQAELGVDSLALATMVFRLEEVFGISLAGIDLQSIDMGKLQTVEDLLRLSHRIVDQARAAAGG